MRAHFGGIHFAAASDLPSDGFREQSFAAFLTRQAPAAVEGKLRAWGVHDFGSNDFDLYGWGEYSRLLEDQWREPE